MAEDDAKFSKERKHLVRMVDLPSRVLSMTLGGLSAGEAIRRAKDDDDCDRYVVRLSDPPTPQERLQLLAARLQRTPIVIMPHPCKTVDEWIARYGEVKDG